VVLALAYIALMGAVTVSLVSALSFPDQAWNEVGRSRAITATVLALTLVLWILVLAVPHYWVVVRPRLRSATRALDLPPRAWWN
jgi:hypothetical protein